MDKTKKYDGKKIINITILVLFLVIALVGLTVIFLQNYNAFSPSRPIVLDDGRNVYITTAVNDSYKGYRFKFKSEEGTFVIDTKSNILSSQEVIENGGEIGMTYKVTVCYLAQKKGNNSEYSKPATWTICAYLDSPKISYNRSFQTIEWLPVEHADFYRVFYNGNESYIETEKTSINVSEIESGERTISVLAYSNDPSYKTGNKSNTLDLEVFHYLKGFTNAGFDKATKVFTAQSEEKYDRIVIILDREYEITAFSVTEKEGKFDYSVDLSVIYEGQARIGIYPVNIDEYNVNPDGNILYYDVPAD